MDSFDEQISLSNLFKHKIESMINVIGFAHPNDASKLQKTIDLFFESSLRLSRDKMKKILDLHSISGIKGTTAHTTKKLTDSQLLNNQWENNWLEQINEVGNKIDVSSVANNNMDDFCFYINVAQSN
ncbi:MAG: hypothetical protein ACYDCN_13050 [Bacteroidia bacterium]